MTRWIVLVAWVLLPSTAAGQVWVEEATTKVLKDAEPGASEARISAARNEREGFQVVIRAGEEPLVDVTVEVSDLGSDRGAVLSLDLVELSLEYYVYVEKPSPCDPLFCLPDCGGIPEYLRSPGWYPDALVPFFDPYAAEKVPVAAVFDVPAGDLQTVFVDIFVPEGTPAGDYHGALSVRAGDEEIEQVPVSLHLWDFSLPATRTVATSYGLTFSYIKRYHGGPDGPDEDAERQFIRNYEVALHRHRIDLEEHRAPIKIEVDEQGDVVPIDFSEFDAAIGPRIDGSFYPDGVGINRFALKTFGPGKGHDDLTDDQWGEAARIVAEHLADKGWLDHVYLYSLDEPWQFDKWWAGSYENIVHDVDVLWSHTDLWNGKVMVTGPWDSMLDDAVDIWCPDTAMYGGDYYGPGAWPGAETYTDLLAAGRVLWFYVCRINVPPFLGYDVDTRVGYEPRLLKWQAWHEGATGFLFWTTNYWNSKDPWHTLVTFPDKFEAELDRHGNGILIYPGDHDGTKTPTGSPDWVSIDGPVLSYRIKQISDGLEDWELFRLAEGLGAGKYARSQVARVHKTFAVPINASFDVGDPPWTLDEAALLDARRNVARKVQHLLHPDRYDDPEAPRPEPGPEGFVEPTLDVATSDSGAATDAKAGVDHAAPAAPTSTGRSGCTAGLVGPRGEGPLSALALVLLAMLLLLFVGPRRQPVRVP